MRRHFYSYETELLDAALDLVERVLRAPGRNDGQTVEPVGVLFDIFCHTVVGLPAQIHVEPFLPAGHAEYRSIHSGLVHGLDAAFGVDMCRAEIQVFTTLWPFDDYLLLFGTRDSPHAGILAVAPGGGRDISIPQGLISEQVRGKPVHIII